MGDEIERVDEHVGADEALAAELLSFGMTRLRASSDLVSITIWPKNALLSC